MSDPSPSPSHLMLARQRADAARCRFNGAFIGLRNRVSPDRIKDDAISAVSGKVQAVQDRTKQSVRKHPVIVGTATVGALALLFWRPARLLALYTARGAWFVWLNRALWSRNDK